MTNLQTETFTINHDDLELLHILASEKLERSIIVDLESIQKMLSNSEPSYELEPYMLWNLYSHAIIGSIHMSHNARKFLDRLGRDLLDFTHILEEKIRNPLDSSDS